MGKISPVASKYMIHASIEIDGVVDKPDVIGAIFGQTEGLLGSELELRELQRSGRIGRIEVNTDTRTGKTKGTIIIPSSLDKAETAIVAAALEIIQRIGPCNAKLRIENIEDVRISKRQQVVDRAKELLKMLMNTSMPDSQELVDEIAYSIRVMEVQEYGKERLPAGPGIDESDEILVVEGRADVLNLLKHGIKNAIAINGTSVPETIIELGKKKTITAFVDGDRGGDLILRELLTVAEIDFVTKAPDGKEVEELAQKEILKSLRSRITAEQAKLELLGHGGSEIERLRRTTIASGPGPMPPRQGPPQQTLPQPVQSSAPQGPRGDFVPARKPGKMTADEKKAFKDMLEGLVGTRGAYLLDAKLKILGKIPVTEVSTTLKSLGSGAYAVVMDGVIDRTLLESVERSSIQFVVAADTKSRQIGRVNVVTSADLE